jgi:hypothetical protein
METTTDYKIFKSIRGNREIYPGHVEKLRAAIKNKNLLPYIPLLLNEHMQVIDGQHRLEVAKLDKLEVTYAVIPDLRLKDVMSLNIHSKSWSTVDFVDAYIKDGDQEYQKLKDFSAESGISLYPAAGLLMNGPRVRMPHSDSQLIRTGKFEVTHLEWARMFVEHLDDLQRYCEFNVKSSRTFQQALGKVENSPNFDIGILLSKLKLSNLRIEIRKNPRYYILEIEELYNYRNKNRVDLYSGAIN